MKRLLFILLAFVAINSFGQTKKFTKITTKFLNVKYPITTDSDGTSANWYTAFDWGNHATQGYLTNYVETDPTVSAWAKAASKPTYTYNEVGAAAADHGDHGLAAHAASSTAHPRDTRSQIAGSYLTSFTESDPSVPSHVKSITPAEKDTWNTGYNPTNANRSDVDWNAKDFSGESLRLSQSTGSETAGYYTRLISYHSANTGELAFRGGGGEGLAIGGLDYGATTGLYANAMLVAKLTTSIATFYTNTKTNGTHSADAFSAPDGSYYLDTPNFRSWSLDDVAGILNIHSGDGNGAVNINTNIVSSGSITALDVSTTSSDIRLKHAIKPIENLETYDQIHFRQFYMNKDSLNERLHVGVVADDVLKTHPEFVYILQDSMKTKTVNYEGLLCAKVARLEQRMDELNERAEPESPVMSLAIIFAITLVLIILIRKLK